MPYPHKNLPASWWQGMLYWLFHLSVLCAMVLFGRYLGEQLIRVVLAPVAAGDLSQEWWQIFTKFAAVITGGLFLAVVTGYVLLIWPER